MSEETKVCTRCFKKKSLDDFYTYSAKSLATGKVSKTGIHPECKDCGSKSARARKVDYRSKVSEIKLLRGCVDCGYKEHPEALDFDHLPGTIKEFDITHGWKFSWEQVLEEIVKCEVVCSNCHRVRTFNRRQKDG